MKEGSNKVTDKRILEMLEQGYITEKAAEILQRLVDKKVKEEENK